MCGLALSELIGDRNIQMKKFFAVAALSTFAALLVAGSNPKATGSVGWVNPYSGQQVETTFNALATTPTGTAAKGSFVYSDDTITYSMDVQYLKVDKNGKDAWFAGQVTSTNTTNDCCTVGTWIVYRVQDNGEPGVGADKVWGFSTKQKEDPNVAYQMVKMEQPLNMGSYTDSGMLISSGNVQVH
jgi:hypothetical protein